MRFRKRTAVVALACLLCLACVGGALAWLSATGVLVNQFGIGTISPAVDEKLDGAVKSDVRAKNDGTAPAFLRAQVDMYWQDDAGVQLWEEPEEGTDYSIAWGSDVSAGGSTSAEGAWVKGADGFWYWTASVAPLGESGQLIKTVSENGTHDGRHLVVDVEVQGIQSSPEQAVSDAWGCMVSNGLLVPPSGQTKGEQQ